MRLRTGARADQEVYLPFFDFENDIVCAKLAEKLQTAYEGLKKKSEVTLVEPEQPKTPKGNEHWNMTNRYGCNFRGNRVYQKKKGEMMY